MNIIGLVHMEKRLFGIVFPDLPGCVSVGDSFQDVLDMGAEALALHLEGMIEDGDVIPSFRALADLEVDPGTQGEIAQADLAVQYAVKLTNDSLTVDYSLDENPLKHLRTAAE